MNLQKHTTQFLFLIGLVLLTSVGCNQETVGSTIALQVHMQGGFYQEQVEIILDDKSILDVELSTREELGFALSFVAGVEKGNHTLEILTEETGAIFTFKVKKELAIGINYDPVIQELTAIYSKDGFYYD